MVFLSGTEASALSIHTPHLNLANACVTRALTGGVARERLGGLTEDGRRGDGSRLRLPLLPLPADSFHLVESAGIQKHIFFKSQRIRESAWRPVCKGIILIALFWEGFLSCFVLFFLRFNNMGRDATVYFFARYLCVCCKRGVNLCSPAW